MTHECPPDFVSDGCTVPFFLREIFKSYADDCRWHDWARRHLVYYGVMTVEEADSELYKRWINRGMWKLFARLAWNVVKFMRRKYEKSYPFPSDKQDWHKYIQG